MAILAGAAVAIIAFWPRKATVVRLVVTMLATLATTSASVQYVLLARTHPHGLANFMSMSDGSFGTIPFALSEWPDSFAFIAKNLSGFVYLAVVSAEHAPEGAILLQNLNPLPGGDAVESANAMERYLPWAPLSTAGELYGAFGAVSLICFTSLLAIAAVWGVRGWGQGGASHITAVVVYGLVPLSMIWTAQYSTRNAFRVAWLLIGASAVALLAQARYRQAEADQTRPRRSAGPPRPARLGGTPDRVLRSPMP